MVQIGPKSQFGGLKAGWFNKLYQFGMEEKVNREPITPADWQRATEIINFKILLGSFTLNISLQI